MTPWERAILDALAERFPRSAQASGGRALRLGVGRAFPDLDRRKPDEYESFLEAAESLERKGIVSLSWAGRARGENLVAITLADEGALYAALGRASPAASAALVRDAAKAAAADMPSASSAFFRWLSENLSARDLDPDTLEPLPETVADAARLARSLEPVASGACPAPLTRALSVELFSDSKRVERVLRAMQWLLSRAASSGVTLPPFELVDRSYPETFVAGPLSFAVAGGSRIENPSGLAVGLPFATVSSIERVSVASLAERGAPLGAGRLLGVENKESFFDLAARLPSGSLPFDALAYVGGHPNRAVQSLVRLFAASGWAIFHAGDLDPDGILILQELSDAAGVPVIPWMMDRATFDRYRASGRPIDAEAHRRAALVRDETRSRSGLGELLEAILAAGVAVEQEIIAY